MKFKSSFSFKSFVVSAVAALFTSCASNQLLREKDYNYSLNAYRSADPGLALDEFPKLEEGGFVTSVEKSWLGFWENKPSVEPLLKQVKTFDDRQYISVTREAETFLLQESEEGYIPSEQEVVTLHLVAAMNYMELQKWEDAAVEARLAGFYLQNPSNENQTHFDDPALRLWLAGVWTALGDWNSAQVDLRKAGELANDKTLIELANKATPPTELGVAFTGVAPEVQWSDDNYVPDFIGTSVSKPSYKYTFGTDAWFKYHKFRNTTLRDDVSKSNYMGQYIGVKAASNVKRAGGHIGAATFSIVGIALGGAIIAGGIYAAASAGANSGEGLAYILAAGVGIIDWSVTSASKWDAGIQTEADQQEKSDFENMRKYRFVRFMPAWISIEANKISARGPGATTMTLNSPTSKTKVSFINNY